MEPCTLTIGNARWLTQAQYKSRSLKTEKERDDFEQGKLRRGQKRKRAGSDAMDREGRMQRARNMSHNYDDEDRDSGYCGSEDDEPPPYLSRRH